MRSRLLQKAKSFLSGAGRRHRGAVFLQNRGEDFKNRRCIVDHEHANPDERR
jgi:hypothetical protein